MDFQNFQKSNFEGGKFLENLIIHKPSLGSCDDPQKIWARSVQPFSRLLDTNGQTDKQTDKPNLYIDKITVSSISVTDRPIK